MKLTVNVTKEDLSNGTKWETNTRKGTTGCPIALAIKRTLPEAKRIMVSLGEVNFYYHNKLVSYKLPQKVSNFIIKFDTYGYKRGIGKFLGIWFMGPNFEPFSFEMEEYED